MTSRSLFGNVDWRSAAYASPNERHHRVLVYLDVIFGGYCVTVAAAASLAWWRGDGTLQTVLTVLTFLLVNAGISQISHRTARPGLAEAGRALVGAVIAPLAYLATDAPFGMWWPGFLIMALGGAVFFGLLTGSAVPGRVVSLYYAGSLFLTELLANPQPNWYALWVGAGAIVMVGFLLAEIVALLDRALAAERSHSEALRAEKARSERLLQREAEEALRASEAHFRTLIEHSSDGISIVDRHRRFRYLSPAAERILARPGATLVGQPFETVVHPEEHDRTKAEFAQRLAAPHDVRIVESRILRPDGSVRLLEIVGRVLPSGDVVVNLRDVTERRQMERSFRAIVEGTAGATGEDFFTSLVEHLATALGVDHAFVAEMVDAPPSRVRTIAFWSCGCVAENIDYGLAGTPCQDVVAGTMCFHATGVQQAFPADRDLVTLGADSYLGMPLRDSSGAICGHIAVLDNGPMRDEATRREILAVFAARAGAEIERQRSLRALRTLNAELEGRVRERTAQLQAALHESSRLSAVLEATADIVGMASLDGRTTYLNRAGRRRLGLADDENVERYHISTFYTDESFRVIATDGIPAAMKHGTWSGEVVMRSLRGEEIPVSLAGNMHFDEEGIPKYISAIARDISESKRIAAELQSAKEAAEAASRSKSTFLATMSHEIRTPMNAVIGMTDLLLATTLTTRQREFVETIRGGGDALLTVINDILDFSKIEAGRLELEHRPFNLRFALESAVDLLAPRAAEKGLELALSIDPTLPTAVIGDEVRIRQILVNLIGNGVKFTERGEIVVSATGGQTGHADSEIQLLLSVRDTGIGIPVAKQNNLFTSFSQLDPSTTREYGGTGLGLAISKRLVELMGGTICVQSDGVRGHGSVFHFNLRLGRVADEWSAPGAERAPVLAGRRVLVVDDNATNRQILGLQLQAWGMFAVEAALPTEALDLLDRRDRFDLVVLDMQMPGMDGLSLAKAICSRRTTQPLPIIMLTSIGRDVGPDALNVPCFAGQLTKPVKSSQLYDAIVGAIVGPCCAAVESGQETVADTVHDGQPASGSLRILVAEDMEVNRKFALLALEELGFEAAFVVNGAEVLRALHRRPFDIVLMDVHMPEIDGLEATRRIRRELPADRQPYIIAMTANAMRGDREICMDAGMDDYLSKPVYLTELRAAIDRAAERLSSLQRVDAAVPMNRKSGQSTVAEPFASSVAPELIDLYLEEADATLQRLRQAFVRGDSPRVREEAHALKGASGYVGATGVLTSSAAVERTLRLGEEVDETAVNRIGEEFEKFRRGLPARQRENA